MESQEVAVLTDRLERVEERGTLLAVLAEFKRSLAVADRWQVAHLARTVLSSLSTLSRHLTASEVSSHLSEILVSLEPVSRILVLYSVFLSNSDEIYGHLLSALRPESLEAVLKSSVRAEADDERFEEAVSCLVSVPDKLSNFGKRLSPTDVADLRTWLAAFPTSIFLATRKAVQSAVDRVQSNQDANLRTISLLVSRGRNLTLKDSYLLDHVVHWLCDQPKSAIWDRLAQRIFTDDSHGLREFDSMLTALIRVATCGQDLVRCLGYSIKTKDSVRSTMRRLLLQRVNPYRVPHILAEYVAETGQKDIFSSFFMDLMTVWSDVSFVQFNPIERQHYVTLCVLEFGRRIGELELDEVWSQLVVAMANGVHARLANADPSIRQSGLFVGQMCSKWKGDAEPLKFDYEEDDWLQTMRRAATGGTEVEQRAFSPIEQQPSTSYALPDVSKLSIRPTEAVDSDDEVEFEGEYIPEEESNFQPLKEGEEPEKSHPAPNYIGDAMEWLTEKDQYDKFEAALFCLEPMIRRNAVGLNDIAPKLATRLLHLEDKFRSKDFEKIRRGCLVACLVMHPELAPSLGDALFSRNCTFFTRYLILNCLTEAAKELTEPPKREEKLVKAIPEETVDASDWQSVVNARIKAKTRIISEKRPVKAVHVNRFAPVATMFFYPLLRTSTEEHLELRGRDAPFLARVLITASEILQCGAASASVVKMATSLSSLVWSLRFHDEVSVRTAVMFGYFTIVTVLPSKVLFDVFAKETNSWLEWMCSVADNSDLGEQERTLAKHFASVFVEKARTAQGDH